MNLYALEIPDDEAHLADWLERHLVGLHVTELVRQLEVVQGAAPADAPRTLADALADRLPRVLDEGLGTLPPAQLQSLLRQPQLLLELQEQVCMGGGSYWSGVTRSAEHLELASDGWRRLQTVLQTSGGKTDAITTAFESAAPKTVSPVTSSVTISAAHSQRRRRLWLVGLVSFAAAAVVLVAVTLSNRASHQPWGWEKPGVFAAQLSAPEYLNHVADTAQEWFRKRPDTKEGLLERLHQMRRGCDALQAAQHAQLVAADKDWLLERCQVWAKKFDDQIAALEAGQSVTDIRSAADETVNKLITALRERAKQSA